MSTERTRRWMHFRAWHIPAALLALLLVGLAVWLLPRRAQEVVLVDGAHRWKQNSAPPQRKIVWRPAQPIAASVAEPSPQDSLVRPQLAEGGTALYYTLQRPGQEADIYRSQFDGQRWLPGVAVAGLNSPASDFGPVISADGQSLYFYSDRPGGYGGFDLYIAQRTASGWSEPQNLGPVLNTPAQEYDPALTPDGQRLFFASNRTLQMKAQIAAAQQEPGGAPSWKATLRAEPGLRQFDLYVAERSTAAKPWIAATSVTALNTAAANEGEPFVSPDGAFLYFASDRQNASGAGENYDLYRARLANGSVAAIENLGPGVNTAANEHDPALSPEGFRIVFSSDRSQEAKAPSPYYALYTSQATETFDDAYWDTSHIAALAGLWWWIVLALILLGLLAALVWYLREVSLRRAPVPVFFLIALLLHLLALTGAFFIPIEGVTIAERISRQIEKIVATDIQLESTHQSHEAGEKSYEKIADLQSLETTRIALAPRQVVQTPNMPFPTERPAPTLPNRLNREQLHERVATSGPVVVQEVQDPHMERRQKIVEQMLAESAVKIDPTRRTEVVQQESTMPSEDVAASRTALPQRVEIAASLPRRHVDVKSQLEQEKIAAERTDQPSARPTTTPPAQPLERVARNDTTRLETPEIRPVNLAQPAASAAASAGSAPQVDVSVERSAASREVQVTPPAVTVATSGSVTSTITADLAVEPVAASAPAASVVAVNAPAEMARRGATASAPAVDSAEIAAAEIPAAVAERTADATGSSPAGEAVQVDRTSSGTAFAEIARLSGVTTSRSTSATAPSAVEATGRETSDAAGPPSKALAASSAALARAASRSTLAEAAEIGRISTEDVAASGPATSREPAVAGVEVQLARSQPGEAISVNVETPDILGGRYDARRSDLVVGQLAKAEVDADISFSPIGSTINRQRARAPFLLYAQDKIGLQAMLRLRVGDDTQKQDLIDAFGGNKETLAAIQRGLHWLALVQLEDGRWALNEFPRGPAGEKFTGQGSEMSDTAATGLALLPFLGDGHTHETGKYQATVARGIDWLLQQQKDDGDLFSGGSGNAHLYSHGIATIVLCEAFGMSNDEKLSEPAQRAVKFIVDAQHDEGGWRYRPRERGDTSVVGWQIMALKSAQMAGLEVPQATLDKARQWLSRSRHGKDESEFGYQPGGGGTPAMTAEGLLCMEYLGGKRGEPQLMRTVDVVLSRLPKKHQDTSYYWYYGTQAMFHMQGEPWQKWNEAMSDTVLSSQVASGPHLGTWDPRDEYEKKGGRIYATSLRLLMLEVYFRHLPLYQALE